jgi:hypothetical protein
MSEDELIRSHRDSLHFRNHPLFSIKSFACRLQVFYDDVEVVNPLGSKTKKHEVGMFYFTIFNLPPMVNSSLSNIFAFAVVKSKYLKEGDFSFILRKFMSELKEL